MSLINSLIIAPWSSQDVISGAAHSDETFNIM